MVIYKTFKHIFKDKRNDVVQFVIILAVASIIVGFSFTQYRDKMGKASNDTNTNVDTALSAVQPNSNSLVSLNGPVGNAAIPVSTFEDFADSNFVFPISTTPGYTLGWVASGGEFVGFGNNQNNIGVSSNITITIPANQTGTLNFDYRTYSELNYDKLYIYLDSTSIVSGVSGNTSSVHYSKTGITAGTHTLKVVYQKDGSVSYGSDAVYIDNLQLLTS